MIFDTTDLYNAGVEKLSEFANIVRNNLNSLESSNSTDTPEGQRERYKPFYVSVMTLIILVLFAMFCMALTILMLPFYLVVFKRNRSLEKDIPVYPILYHLRTVLLVNLATVVFCVIVIVISDKQENVDFVVIVSSAISITLSSYYAAIFLMPIFNILLSTLAFQRIFLYFIPSRAKFIVFRPSTWSRIIKISYLISIFINVTVRAIKIYQSGFNETYWVTVEFYEMIYMKLYIYIELLVLISTFLYIPIYRSVRKLSNMMSVATFNPEKYIAYQVFLIFILKVPLWIISCHSYWLSRQRTLPISFYLIIFVLINSYGFIAMSTTIELTYLWCNKRNVPSLLSILVPRRSDGLDVEEVSTTALRGLKRIESCGVRIARQFELLSDRLRLCCKGCNYGTSDKKRDRQMIYPNLKRWKIVTNPSRRDFAVAELVNIVVDDPTRLNQFSIVRDGTLSKHVADLVSRWNRVPELHKEKKTERNFRVKTEDGVLLDLENWTHTTTFKECASENCRT